MKRLLVMSYFYPPLAGGGVHRVLAFTDHLRAHGWACTVICAGEHDYWVRDPSLSARVPVETEVIRVSGGSALATLLRSGRAARTDGRRSSAGFALLRPLSEWFLLPDSYVGWSHRAARAAAARVAHGDVDAILSSSPPDSVHLAAGRVARASGLPWVADFRDPWIGLNFKRPPTPWHAARQRALESRVTGGADLVLAASRTHHDALVARVEGRPRQVLHLPNGFEPVPEAASAPSPSTHFTVAFTGTLSGMRDAGTLLDAVDRLVRETPAARGLLRVVLAGPLDDEWPKRAHALGLDDVVHWPGPLPHAATRALQRSADVLLLWKPQGEGFRTMVPGKTYEYLDSGRPVVALLPAGDEAAGLVERAGGTRLEPGDAASLARELGARFQRWRDGERIAAARPAWLDEHRRDRLAARLAESLAALPSRGRA